MSHQYETQTFWFGIADCYGIVGLERMQFRCAVLSADTDSNRDVNRNTSSYGNGDCDSVAD